MDANKLKAMVGQETPDKVGVPDLREQIYGKIVISSGWDGDDYVWHISTAHQKIPFTISERTLLHEIASLMNQVIPDTCRVDIFTPYMDWDIKMYTFKAHGLKQYWQINKEALEELLKKLFARLNTFVR